MNPSLAPALPLLGLALLALLSAWADQSLQSPLPAGAARDHGADHSFTAPLARLYDSEGRLAYEARGARLEHRAESGDYLLEQANLTVHPRPGAEDLWQLQSERARFLADRTHAMLEGEVKAERRNVLPASAMRFHARDVRLDLKARSAESALPMTAEGLHWHSRADRFRADFTTEQLTQEGRVHDRHDPIRR
ncbi:MAG: LPS export ABC transporter periplasmic protein LptC [Pseudomonadota bacterium]